MTQRTVLETVQEFCRRQSLELPSVVLTSQDETVQNILGLLREAAEELVTLYDWKETRGTIRFHHANLAGGLAFPFPFAASQWTGTGDPGLPHQGNLEGQWSMQGLVLGTMWDLTNSQPLTGPLTDIEWSALVNMGVAPSPYHWKIGMGSYGGDGTVQTTYYTPPGIMIYPVPNPPSSVWFSVEYHTSWYAADATTGLPKYDFLVDSDWCLLPSELMMAELRWKWKKEKGMPYAEDQRTSDTMRMQFIGRLGAAGEINMGGEPAFPQMGQPGLLIAVGKPIV